MMASCEGSEGLCAGCTSPGARSIATFMLPPSVALRGRPLSTRASTSGTPLTSLPLPLPEGRASGATTAFTAADVMVARLAGWCFLVLLLLLAPVECGVDGVALRTL